MYFTHKAKLLYNTNGLQIHFCDSTPVNLETGLLLNGYYFLDCDYLTDLNDFNICNFNRNILSEFAYYSIVPNAADPKLKFF